MRAALHITNGDSAAGTMKEAGISGEILAWRDVLHDGPVPAGLSLAELSRVRASYLASEGRGDFDEVAEEFISRDALLQQLAEFDRVVLWFEWDLYDQLQLIQILDFIAGGLDDSRQQPPVDVVSIAGYLGGLPAGRFPALYEQRSPISREMLSLGQTAWRAFTSSDPRQIVALLEAGTAALPFLDGALARLLDELPWVGDGLSRAERQLLEAIAGGSSQFGEAFRVAASREERVYCGDASAAGYLERLSRGDSPLVVYPSGERVRAPRSETDSVAFRSMELALTDAGRAVLAGERDWIELGGSDRWLGGVHLDGVHAPWRWNPETRNVSKGSATA